MLAVACRHTFTTGLRTSRADELARRLPRSAWQRYSAGSGAKGHRYYDWAWVATDPGQPGHHWLLIRRNHRTRELAYYRCYSPRHVPLATLPGMADRTVTISGISKSYSVTGWRIGYAVANPELSVGIRRAHDFITVGAPHPLQEAAVTALELPDSYYVTLRESYQARRDLLLGKVKEAGFVAYEPRGAYYILTDAAHFFSRYGCRDDHEFAMFLIKEIGVATVPGSSFYAHAELGRTKIRFCFPKTDDMLIEAGRRLQKLRS